MKRVAGKPLGERITAQINSKVTQEELAMSRALLDNGFNISWIVRNAIRKAYDKLQQDLAAEEN